ncbi:ArsR/SmtB family transcription factor [Paenibacillus sp. GCM10023248]|uniref:ArsR/SmtB family transcription factor n=1 Tax=unclassified Paenibacillus TaxID=185978 RepID=UPI002378475C|nr:ArsR family transcriptional regulator [Paenibacillus sp. MAHUQ-63]MDD9266951.1 ArsR family transcriptional regulator [Paenibacillus sp. MAHUQ-63]
MHIEVSTKNMAFLECFSSETRVKMIELLQHESLNIKQLSQKLDISSAIVTKHVQKLEQAGILVSENTTGIRGTQKICHLNLEQAVLQFRPKKPSELPTNTIAIPVGQYASFEVKPTCGLASSTQLIGVLDDPRYFADPGHVHAGILWFASGYVEYRIPNFLHSNQKLRTLEISFEICSEAPGYNENWPSDISFYINDVPLGYWTSPGDFGAQRGILTPDWWSSSNTQHGLLKVITVSPTGSYLDGTQISDTTIQDLSVAFGKDITFRIASLESSANCGGITLFGKSFGNYAQDIVVSMHEDK